MNHPVPFPQEVDTPRPEDSIRIRGARQNNLKNLSLDIPAGQLVVVTGVSGSGKSSLVFDTLYAEGQRRYVETFSPYARQFLDRMDKPQVDAIEGIPPAIAIDQTNPVRTSRSTVGTMTELNDHLKLLFARAASLHCRACAQPVRRDSPEAIVAALFARASEAGDPRLVITFPVPIPENFSADEVLASLKAQGYDRIHARSHSVLEVVQDRLRLGESSAESRARVAEAIEAALRIGQGRVNVYPLSQDAKGEWQPGLPWRYSSGLHCAECDIHYGNPSPSLFSFNSPVGACEVCRGFGRVIGVDYGLVIPNERLSLREGAIKPWQTESNKDCQRDLLRWAPEFGVRLDTPWCELTDTERKVVIEGDPAWKGKWNKQWYGVARFFKWLESKSYKMHVRVLLSRYRAYTPCEACGGARLKNEALLWRLGTRAGADAQLPPEKRFLPLGSTHSRAALEALPGLTVHDMMLLPIERTRDFFGTLQLPAPLDEAADLLLTEVRARLSYLCQVGLGYLTLDRQSRTLSGGEVQRINLTTALGTSLVNTLFVLDEPSIGLHPRDMGKVIEVMKKLRDAGNSLVVVEHDPQIMFAADRLIDMGPGPGERGGEVVFQGPATEVRHTGTLTADYLTGRKRADAGIAPRASNPLGPNLELLGASEHNLKDIDIRFPLKRLVCITGVSGSGKSTLVQDVLYSALRKDLGKPTETPGAFRELRGAELIEDVVMVDQTPIGKTTRSNPASYVGAFDAIRSLFANDPVSRERGYGPGTFSFNAGANTKNAGRCPTCGGNGFEHVEMQFLSDVYIRCPDCDGKRFRGEVLEVTLQSRALGARAGAKSIADVLDMTVSEALQFFADRGDVVAALAPLADVGLEYLKLGQPVPTLSGGEAQRLKLAGHLAEAAKARSPAPSIGVGGRRRNTGKLFLFDEPTTGLHFDDVAKLLKSFRKLLDSGHSLVVIEHNLDVIRACDWIIELGPEGGEAGGALVASGMPADLMKHPDSHTARALREYEAAFADPEGAFTSTLAPEPTPSALAARDAADLKAGRPLQSALRERRNSITIRAAREHNLKGVDVDIPRNRFTVVTGVSGSGKSTLAFDIVFAEGQRRYLESLNAYARQFVQPAARPDVDAIFGIPPTVAIEQRTSRGGRKSTVATLTEVYHFLRLLYVKLGTQHCPDCQVPIEPQSLDVIVARLMRTHRGQRIGLLAPLVMNRKGFYTDLAKWAQAKGYGFLRVDGEFLPTNRWPRLDRFQEHTLELPVADIKVAPENEAALREGLARALEFGKGVVHVLSPLEKLAAAREKGKAHERIEVDLDQTVFSTKRACPSCGRSFPELDPRLFSYNSKHGWCGTCFGTGAKLPEFDAEQTGEEVWWNDWFEGVVEACGTCDGKRLNREALAVRYHAQSIADIAALPVHGVKRFFDALELEGREAEIARDIVAELRSRLGFLEEVGLSYLSLDRSAPTLSGGEAQRIRLASQLGSNLRGVCYILDEPTIGLHPRDNGILLKTLEKLEAKGNTLIVVEHDEDTIRRAHHVIDLGPGAGRLGGRVIAQGTAEQLMLQPDSITGRFLLNPLRHPLHPTRKVAADTPSIELRGANLHNLKDASARIPLGRLVVVTGVSGSGKSTLARDVLRTNLEMLVAVERERGRTTPPPVGCASITGAEGIGRVLEVDQTPIGKTPRSCPATYVGFWDAIRRLFAETNEGRMRGYKATRFSFNTSGGRCDACEGQGMKRIEMSFLPDVKVPCEVCNGARFNAETLAVQWKGKSIGEVLMLSVDEAVEFFAAHTAIHHALRLLQDVGLGYLTLGQQSPTLSGGEAQRIKLVTELAKVRADGNDAAARPGRAGAQKSTLYVLDEPTVGLHMADVEKLIRVLHRLVDAGNTVVVIEHNLDVWADADWIIDLGPEGGDNGGRVVAQGSPKAIASKATHTGEALAAFLAERSA
jgi:excinuclease ABC subunit A